MPNTIEGVECGPQKPGTQKPSGSFDASDLARLNPCTLNACCLEYGHCGTTSEFCIEKPGAEGCISNCGTEIVRNDNPPDQFRRVVYFEAYNGNRPCLIMDVTELLELAEILTHVYFAFAGFTEDFKIRFAEGVNE